MGRPEKEEMDKETVRIVTRISHRTLESVWGNNIKKAAKELKAFANGKVSKVKPKKDSKK
jgi:hypothetical protein